ncbi:serine/threonine protein kinase [Virgibacillus oceani]
MVKTLEYIDGKYKIVSFLCEGGTSHVYEVEIAGEERAVLKISKQPTTLLNDQIDNEAKILAAVNHENIPKLFDKVMVDRHYHGIIMEKLEGKRLSDIIENEGRKFDWQELLDVAKQLADIIQTFHQKNSPIVIRDIKPSNILLSNRTEVHLIDFGTSAVLNAAERHKALGTIGYAAPEQFENGGIDLRSDLFSFGATLFYIVSGGKNIYTSNARNILSNNLPKSFAHFILKLTETNADERYDSIDQVINKLNRVRPTFLERIFRSDIDQPM